jgi:hypothetical protein
LTLVCAGVVVAGGGCAGGSERVVSPPRLPQRLAVELAVQADAVAASLERGDVCGASAQARVLRSRVLREAGRVAVVFRGELVRAAGELAATVPPCPPPPAPAPAEKEGHGKGKGKGKGNHGEGQGRGG